MNLQQKIVRNAESSNPKKNPAMRRRFHARPSVEIVTKTVRVSAVKPKRERPFGTISPSRRLNLTDFQHACHEANKHDPQRHAKGGAFGGITKRARFRRALAIASKPATAKAA